MPKNGIMGSPLKIYVIHNKNANKRKSFAKNASSAKKTLTFLIKKKNTV